VLSLSAELARRGGEGEREIRREGDKEIRRVVSVRVVFKKICVSSLLHPCVPFSLPRPPKPWRRRPISK